MFKAFPQYLETKGIVNLVFILHNNADPDAVGAAFALAALARKFLPEINFEVFSDDINQSSKNAVKELGLKINQELPGDYDNALIVSVDTANIIQLGKYREWVETNSHPLMVVDHHDTEEFSERAILKMLDSNSGSTCLMVASAYQQLGELPSEQVATLLIMGHLYDSRRFIHGVTSQALNLIAWLIEIGGNYPQANEFLQNKPSSGERVARMKAVQRVRYKQIGDILIATSYIGAYEASVARALSSIGADVVLVLGRKKSELRGSARSTKSSTIDVATIIEKIADELGGDGGGHTNAAGFNIKRVIDKKEQKQILERFTKLVTTQLKIDNTSSSNSS